MSEVVLKNTVHNLCFEPNKITVIHLPLKIVNYYHPKYGRILHRVVIDMVCI